MKHKSKKNRNQGEGKIIKIKKINNNKQYAVRRYGEYAVRWGEGAVRHDSREIPSPKQAQRHVTASPIQ